MRYVKEKGHYVLRSESHDLVRDEHGNVVHEEGGKPKIAVTPVEQRSPHVVAAYATLPDGKHVMLTHGTEEGMLAWRKAHPEHPKGGHHTNGHRINLVRLSCDVDTLNKALMPPEVDQDLKGEEAEAQNKRVQNELIEQEKVFNELIKGGEKL